jgi:hypothetical protein
MICFSIGGIPMKKRLPKIVSAPPRLVGVDFSGEHSPEYLRESGTLDSRPDAELVVMKWRRRGEARRD